MDPARDGPESSIIVHGDVETGFVFPGAWVQINAVGS